MDKVPPISRATSWADVEDETPPSPPRPVVTNPPPVPKWAEDNPPVVRIESRPARDGDQHHQFNHRQAGGNHASNRRGDNTSFPRSSSSAQNKPRSDEGGGRLWEPDRPIKDPRMRASPPQLFQRDMGKKKDQDSAAVQEGSATVASTPKQNAGGKQQQQRKRSAKSGQNSKKKNQILHELFLKNVPISVGDDEIKKAFGPEPVNRIKRVGDDRLYVEFPDKLSMERALHAKLPRWGTRDVFVSIAKQKGASDAGKPNNNNTSSSKDKPVATTAGVSSSEATRKKTAPGVDFTKPKKPVMTEGKKGNAFAALDSDTSEEDEDDEVDPEDDDKEDTEEVTEEAAEEGDDEE